MILTLWFIWLLHNSIRKPWAEMELLRQQKQKNYDFLLKSQGKWDISGKMEKPQKTLNKNCTFVESFFSPVIHL